MIIVYHVYVGPGMLALSKTRKPVPLCTGTGQAVQFNKSQTILKKKLMHVGYMLNLITPSVNCVKKTLKSAITRK